MAEIPDELVQALIAALGGEDEGEDDEPQTVGELLRQIVREELGSGDDGDDGDDGDETPLEIHYAALRHIVQTRFPQADIDAEIGRVTGFELGDDGKVVGNATYEPSNSFRTRVRGTSGPRPGSQRGRGSGQKSGDSGQTKSLAEMTPDQLAAFAREQGDEAGAQMMEAMGARANGSS